MALTHEDAGDAGAAERALARGLEIMPASGDLLFHRGVLLEKRKETAKAIESFREAIKADPNHANAYNYLGYLFAERGENLDEAVALITRAVEIEPDNGYFLDSLGWAYYQKGMIAEALPQMERAASLVSDDAVILEHLGDVYLKAGRGREAVEAWRRALTIAPDNAALKEKIERVP
jgi:tetratricopeptide (TPR) repeat protein